MGKIMTSKKNIVRFLHVLADTMEIPPHQLAAAALEYANGVFGASEDNLSNARNLEDTTVKARTEDRPPNTDVPAVVPLAEPYVGPFHLCLDFGTAMSKAFAWDKESDTPVPLKIAVAAGEPSSSPYVLNSTIFIAKDERVFFGQSAVSHAAATNPERHQAFQSLKDILTVGPMTESEHIPDVYNPTDHPISLRDAIALYLAFLTDSALLALQEDYNEHSRNVSRSFTKPVFDKERDEWATKLLTDCASVAQVLADRFSGRWSDGIPLIELLTVIATTTKSNNQLVVNSAILSEPVAAFVGRIRNVEPGHQERHLMMVVDVGAGTTDFAMYARFEHEGEVRLCRIKDSVTTIRVAGDVIYSALLDFFLEQADSTEGQTRLGAIRADLQRDIRLLKEELFINKVVTRQLVNDMKVTATFEEFKACPAMIRFQERIHKKFHEVLSGVDPSWSALRSLHVFFTGGGAALPMVTSLAIKPSIEISGRVVDLVGVMQPPSWLERECEEVVDAYAQLAVSIGGACHGADKTHLGVEVEFATFAGDVPHAEWRLGGFRDGQ